MQATNTRICVQPLARQCRVDRRRQSQPSLDWMNLNSLQDSEEDTEGMDVMPRMTATM